MDTSTSYLGLRLPHPFIAGASPFGERVDDAKRLEDAGCAAIVLPSLFEEQITAAREHRIHGADIVDNDFPDFLEQFRTATETAFTPDAYAEHIGQVKRAVSMPVIASLNGGSSHSWLAFAPTIQQAGADALELNLYQVLADPSVSAAAIEHEWTGMVTELKRILTIPIAVKLTPFFTAFANVAHQFDQAGADALVLFNRFYQPDIDIRTAQQTIHVGLSSSDELALRLQWLAILHGRVRPALAVSGGVNVASDGIKAVLAGADAVQMVSALLRHGPTHISVMRLGLERWMESNKITRLDEMRGRASLRQTPDAAAYERASYIRTIRSWLR